MHIVLLRRLWRLIGLSAGLVLVTGCANLAPVKTFADQTKAVAGSFTVMPEKAHASCRANAELRDILSPPQAGKPFKLDEVQAASQKQCKNTAVQQAGILALATLLEQYADTLAALADQKLPDYKAQLSGLKSAVDGLKDGSGQPIIPSQKTGAVIALGEFLARLATRAAAQGEIRNLLDQGEGFDAAADALAWYASAIYKPAVRNHYDVLSVALTGLQKADEREPLGARSMQLQFTAEMARLKTLEAAADSFVASVKQMKAARPVVRSKMDSPDDIELWKQIFAFQEEVRGLRKQLNDAF